MKRLKDFEVMQEELDKLRQEWIKELKKTNRKRRKLRAKLK